jgi:hypothetical protein
MSVTIKYNNTTIVDNLESGKTANLPVKDKKMSGNIQVTAVKDTPIYFDGPIDTESGFTTISGSYLVNESKAYDALFAFNGVKTYKVKFSAGGSGSGMGDTRDFTSMTFDSTNGLIKYNDKGAFRMNGGFAEYTDNYGDGNGARVNFEEGTECRKEFRELFLSIADVYDTSAITFTIEGAEYQATRGMTWGDWVVNTEYNHDGFVINNGYFEGGSNYPIRNSSGVSQTATDTIVEGEAYAIDWGGSN